MGIKHFSHKHRLNLYDQNRKQYDQQPCRGCGKVISTGFYGCFQCNYYICKSCAELPREMSHPFHTEHPLALLADSPADSYCNACSKRCEGFIFNCSECRFDLDVNCATLMPIYYHYYYYYYASGQDEEELINHPHPLFKCDRKEEEVRFSCSVCELPIDRKGTIYVCLDCRAILDKPCAQLPQQITHHFHPHHSLTLQHSPYVGYCLRSRCKACRDFRGRFCYSCSECEFSLDVRCASLMPRPIENSSLEVENHLQVVQVPFTHPHVLIPCDTNTNGNFSFSCYSCRICIEEGIVYVCLECRIFLHKSCAELPREIKHPFHPPHPLELRDSIDDQFYQCKACKICAYGFSYWCAKCDFTIDTTCASLKYSTFKFELHHHHPLAFFNQNQASLVPCNSCKIFVSFPYFRCVPCNFNLELLCVSTLPHTFKHSYHEHSLTLSYSPSKDHSDDHDDSEYYCGLCEKIRDLQDPTYYCEKCHYVADVSCVFNEILPLLEREWSDEEIVMLQEKVDALTAKLETLIKNLDELKERRAQHIGDYQIDEEIVMLQAEVDAVRAELETLTTKLDELEERHSQHIGGYQIGSISSLGTKSSTTILDDSDEVAEEDCSVESTKKNEEEDEDEEIDGTFSTLAELDEEIAKLEALTAKLEVLKKKRALLVSCLELKRGVSLFDNQKCDSVCMCIGIEVATLLL